MPVTGKPFNAPVEYVLLLCLSYRKIDIDPFTFFNTMGIYNFNFTPYQTIESFNYSYAK